MASATTGRLAFVQRVVAAHDALQFGELAHHVGQQVGLGQQRRALGEQHVGAEPAGDAARDAAEALGAVAELPSLL
jgi:hypothetical protein